VRSLSQKEIDDMISCPKVIIDAPAKTMRSEKGHKRNGMTLKSKDGELDFSVFMRINEDFEENFSIGLDYLPRDDRGKLCMIRCNGPHGLFLGGPDAQKHHLRYHIHRAKSENRNAGLRGERGAEVTEAYASYKDALMFFLKEIRVINAVDYFPDFLQPTLGI
jgi:hypothetical protein